MNSNKIAFTTHFVYLKQNLEQTFAWQLGPNLINTRSIKKLFNSYVIVDHDENDASI